MQFNLRGTKRTPPIDNGAMRDDDSLWARFTDAAKSFAVKSVVLVVVLGLLIIGFRHAFATGHLFFRWLRRW